MDNWDLEQSFSVIQKGKPERSVLDMNFSFSYENLPIDLDEAIDLVCRSANDFCSYNFVQSLDQAFVLYRESMAISTLDDTAKFRFFAFLEVQGWIPPIKEVTHESVLVQ